jgi:type II secretory pathway component PulJ
MKRLLKQMIRGDEGFSLAETLTVTALLGVILGSAYMAVAMVQSVSDQMSARSIAQEQGQLAIERMVRELRQGQLIYDSSEDPYRFKTCSGTCVSFYGDFDHNGTIDRVTYTYTGGKLKRTLAQSNKAAPTPTDFGADSTSTVLADVDPSVSTIFSYTDASNPPVKVVQADMVNSVLIDLKTIAKSGNTTAAVTFPTTGVQIRAFPTD